MQALVARYPELIADGDGELLLIRREQTIVDSDAGASRWSLDHLFVTRDAVPVLVELKRAVDTRLRREVVGQMLDYAANTTAYWQTGRIADSFANTAMEAERDPEALLRTFLGDQEPALFWEQVDANFKAGRIKLVFVADEIPRELARIVEFLNDQMRAEVRAVELRWFTGECHCPQRGLLLRRPYHRRLRVLLAQLRGRRQPSSDLPEQIILYLLSTCYGPVIVLFRPVICDAAYSRYPTEIYRIFYQSPRTQANIHLLF